MTIDGALGNAWLGHGLCLIRQGHDEAGRRDLQTAAALEPNRSIFHSYLGKAFSNVGDESRARWDLDRAKSLDPNDPTPWIYSAIENRQDSRVNEAVRDLEKSIDLNDNRRIYRSQFLLDQDRAVRSANLAAIYQEDGMDDLSVREATRGVEDDYSNASSHLFLANSYNALRDPKRINLRYETPWFNELLLANLLAPVGGGPLSQFVSEQEYSKLFEANRLGISSTSTYFSTGELRETASQFGIFGNISYSLDTEFQYDNGAGPITKSRALNPTVNSSAVDSARQHFFPDKIPGHTPGRPAPAL
jgi:tetratricopeptide (TPR) repeat protein